MPELAGGGTSIEGVSGDLQLGAGLSMVGGVLTDTDTGGGSPGGSSGQVQYNNAGAFGGTAMTWDGTAFSTHGAVMKFGGAEVQNIATSATSTSAANVGVVNAAIATAEAASLPVASTLYSIANANANDGDITFNGHEATNAADPTAAQSLVTRAYGDAHYGTPTPPAVGAAIILDVGNVAVREVDLVTGIVSADIAGGAIAPVGNGGAAMFKTGPTTYSLTITGDTVVWITTYDSAAHTVTINFTVTSLSQAWGNPCYDSTGTNVWFTQYTAATVTPVVVATGVPGTPLSVPTTTPYGCAINADGILLVSDNGGSHVHMFDLASGQMGDLVLSPR